MTHPRVAPQERQLGLHVDNCLGGFYLSFAQREGLLPSVPMWNFSVRCDAPSARLQLHSACYAPRTVIYAMAIQPAAYAADD